MSCFTGASFLDLVFSGVMLSCFTLSRPKGPEDSRVPLFRAFFFFIQYHRSGRLSRPTIVQGKLLFNTIQLEDSRTIVRVLLCRASIYSMLKGRKTLAYHCAGQAFIQCHRSEDSRVPLFMEILDLIP